MLSHAMPSEIRKPRPLHTDGRHNPLPQKGRPPSVASNAGLFRGIIARADRCARMDETVRAMEASCIPLEAHLFRRSRAAPVFTGGGVRDEAARNDANSEMNSDDKGDEASETGCSR